MFAVKTKNQAPCFSCAMNFNDKGLACFDWCDKLRFWLEIQDAQRAHIKKQEAAFRRAKMTEEEKIAEAEKTCDEVEERLKYWEGVVESAAAPKKHCERQLDEMEQTVDQEVKELIEAIDNMEQREEYTDEEIDAMADEILADLEREE